MIGAFPIDSRGPARGGRSAVCAVLACLSALACCAPAAAGDEGPGYIREFLAVGNWRHVPAEKQLVDRKVPCFEGQMTLGKLWTVVTAGQDGFLDLNVLGPTGDETALVHVYVFSEKGGEYRLLLGSDDRVRGYLNGRLVHPFGERSTWEPDRESVNVQLAAGWNRLLLRVESEAAFFGVSARFTLPDGRPVRLRTRASVPEALLDHPSLKRSLTPERVEDLLELLDARINSVMRQADRMIRDWQGEAGTLVPEYERARAKAAVFVGLLRDMLETIPADTEAGSGDRHRRAEALGERMVQAALGGPYQLTERTRRFTELAGRGSRLWEMVRYTAGTALEAGRHAAEVDRALVEARGLLDALRDEYLRPYRLREQTLHHRTAPVRLRLVRREGIPLADAEVSVEQLSHRFLFGCNLFAFGAMESSEQERQYREQFLRLFNLAVVPVYWPLVEPAEGRRNYVADRRGLPGPEPMVDWCRRHGLAVKGSPLLSNKLRPVWLRGTPADEAKASMEAFVRDAVGRFRGRVDFWDVTWEAWPRLWFRGVDLPVKRVFEWAREADSDAELLLNDPAVYSLLTAAQMERNEGFGLDGVVLAARQADRAWPALELEARLDRLQEISVPVHVGRVMIPGPPEGERKQARAVEAFYRTAFAHPAVESITWWDLSDRFARGARPGGLLREDLSPKPAYRALARLIRDEWWTTARGPCDNEGGFTFRGFFGRYRVRCAAPGGIQDVWEIDLTPGGPREIELTYPSPSTTLASP